MHTAAEPADSVSLSPAGRDGVSEEAETTFPGFSFPKAVSHVMPNLRRMKSRSVSVKISAMPFD